MDFRHDRGRAEQLNVRRIPTFIFFSCGKEVRRASGNLSAYEIRQMFRSPDSLF